MATLIETWDENGDPILSTFEPFAAGAWHKDGEPFCMFQLFTVEAVDHCEAYMIKRELFDDFARWIATGFNDHPDSIEWEMDETPMEYLIRIGVKIIAKPISLGVFHDPEKLRKELDHARARVSALEEKLMAEHDQRLEEIERHNTIMEAIRDATAEYMP